MIISQLSQFYTVNNNLKGIYLYYTPFSAIDTILILHRFYICYEITSYITLVSDSPERGGSAELCEAKGARVRSQIKIFKSCNLCPDSYRSRWSGMASHSLLQRRFAPRKAVRLPSLYPVLFYYSIPDRFLRPFKNDGQVFTAVL